MGRDDPELDLGVDVLGQVDLDGVESQVLERSLDTNRLGLDRETRGLERGGDLVGVDRAVEVPLLVGVGLDGEGPLGDLSAQALKVGAARFFLFLELLAVLLDDQQVVRRGECGQALGKKVIAREAGSDVDQLAGLTDVNVPPANEPVAVPPVNSNPNPSGTSDESVIVVLAILSAFPLVHSMVVSNRAVPPPARREAQVASSVVPS